jgi:hypothetical protein
VKKSTALGISRSGGARNPDDVFTNSERKGPLATSQWAMSTYRAMMDSDGMPAYETPTTKFNLRPLRLPLSPKHELIDHRHPQPP